MAKQKYAGIYKVIEEGAELGEVTVAIQRLTKVVMKLTAKNIEGRYDKGEHEALELQFIEEYGDLKAAMKHTESRMDKQMRKAVNKRRDEKYSKHKRRKFAGIPGEK